MTTRSVQSIRVPARFEPTKLQMSKATITVGSMILTDQGPRLIEDLKAGDMVITKDLGFQKLKYIAFRDVDLRAQPASAPIKVDCQLLGLDHASYFEPDQYFSIRHQMFEMMFGAPEVLIRCGDLSDQPGFERVQNLTSVTYVALGFARRHIISCNGAQIEIGAMAQKPTRMRLGAEEARLALQLLTPKQSQAKRHSFPLH